MDGSTREMPLAELTAAVVLSAVPWRTIRSRRGQHHLSGLYWSATTSGHVLYESRLELGITREHLRYLAREHPVETQNSSAWTAPPRVRFAALLSAEQLRELINQGSSLRQVEARYGISRKTLHDELIAHRIPIPSRAQHRQATDPDR